MFAVHRKEIDAGLLDGVHDQAAARHQRLLICERDILARQDGFVGRTDAHHSQQRVHDELRVRRNSGFEDALGSVQKADARELREQLLRVLFLRTNSKSRLKFLKLLPE